MVYCGFFLILLVMLMVFYCSSLHGTIIRTHVSAPMPALIKNLNQTLRGWANYYRHVVALEAFNCIDTYVYEQLWRMLRRRHDKSSKLFAALSARQLKAMTV